MAAVPCPAFAIAGIAARSAAVRMIAFLRIFDLLCLFLLIFAPAADTGNAKAIFISDAATRHQASLFSRPQPRTYVVSQHWRPGRHSSWPASLPSTPIND